MIYPTLKRLLDLGVASVLAVVLFPLLLVIACLIKADSPGPVLYRGKRSGRWEIPFWMLKFRTMRVNNDLEGTTGLADARITRIGKWLRNFKLDELPQLFNILRGEMSLVGPRPELPRYTSLYNAEEKAILSVMPGITDFSSIEFSSLDRVVGATDVDRTFEEKVLAKKNAFRLKYVREASFGTDLKILWLTFKKLLGTRSHALMVRCFE